MAESVAEKTTVALPPGGGFLLTEVGAEHVDTPDRFTTEQREFFRTARKFALERVLPRPTPSRRRTSPPCAAAPQGRRPRPAHARRPRGVRRPGAGQHHERARRRGHDRARLLVGHLRRPDGHRHAAHRLLRHAAQKQAVPAAARHRRVGRRAYALTEASLGLRRLAARTRAVLSRRREALDPQRHEAVDHQRRLRRRLHRLRQGRRREVHARSSSTATPRDSPSGAEEHKMGIRGSSTCAAHLRGRPGAGGEPARRGRQGAQHRLQHPERRPAQAGRRPAWPASGR